MRARSLFPLVATVLLASACAGKASLSSSSPTPAIVHVGFDQRNTTVDLHVGDLLVVELPGPSPTPSRPSSVRKRTMTRRNHGSCTP